MVLFLIFHLFFLSLLLEESHIQVDSGFGESSTPRAPPSGSEALGRPTRPTSGKGKQRCRVWRSVANISIHSTVLASPRKMTAVLEINYCMSYYDLYAATVRGYGSDF